jgi:hypothetical protein
MMLIAIIASLAGFYLLYNTSARADLRQDKASLWFQGRPVLSRALGSLLVVVSFLLLIISYGFGAGILFGFVTLMTTGSLVTLLSPLTINK